MEIVFISDTHNKHHKIEIPCGDVIVHSGDISGRGSEYEIKDFLEWYSDLEFQHKILVAGNHDFGFEEDHDKYSKLCKKHGIIYLNDEETVIDGVKFWGSPVSPRFFDWAFNREITQKQFFDRINKGLDAKMIGVHWDLIPKDTDVLITHGPPEYILDKTSRGLNVGCPVLRQKVEEIKPKIHVFGHIHEARGMLEYNDTTFINASCLDLRYKPYDAKPFKVELW